MCRHCTHSTYSTSKTSKVFPESSQILSCDTVVANERYMEQEKRFCGFFVRKLLVKTEYNFQSQRTPQRAMFVRNVTTKLIGI